MLLLREDHPAQQIDVDDSKTFICIAINNILGVFQVFAENTCQFYAGLAQKTRPLGLTRVKPVLNPGRAKLGKTRVKLLKFMIKPLLKV